MKALRARDPVSGYTHLGGLGLALVGGIVLARRARPGAELLADVTYATCLVALYAASSAYHLARARQELLMRLRKLDHAAIALAIAGTCTPVFLRAFAGGVRIGMLGAVWTLAAIAIVLRLAWMKAPRALYTAMYVAMGWIVLVQGPRALQSLPPASIVLVVAGGATYTMGAVVYALKRPNPFPNVFGFHEIWHLFVLGGSALHYAAVFSLR